MRLLLLSTKHKRVSSLLFTTFVPKYLCGGFEYLLFALVSGRQYKMVVIVMNWEIHVPWKETVARCLGPYNKLETSMW